MAKTGNSEGRAPPRAVVAALYERRFRRSQTAATAPVSLRNGGRLQMVSLRKELDSVWIWFYKEGVPMALETVKAKYFILLLFICVGLYLVLWPHNRESHSAEFETIVRFSKIGNAIEHFAWDHQGQLPAKLSDLTPQYIDTISNCVYLGTNGISHEVIAYESNPLPNAKISIIPPGGGVYQVTESELDQLLHTNESAVLERLHKERVIYYEANLRASLNSYRIDFGTYPRGDNASVIHVLSGDNPTKTQYHSSYAQERNSHGEDLDPWGTPYFIKSDGNNVQIKSAGTNRKFDELGSTNYDDICNSVSNGSVIGDDTKF